MEYKQITGDEVKATLNETEILFSSTHKKLSLPIINRIYRKMMIGIRFDEIKVFDNLIIDGHHRYMSSILAGKKIGTVKSQKTSATIEVGWKEVEFVEEEWDTDSKIEELNKKDAEYNNMPLEELLETLNK